MGDEKVWVKERNFRDIFMIEETFSVFIEKVKVYKDQWNKKNNTFWKIENNGKMTYNIIKLFL